MMKKIIILILICILATFAYGQDYILKQNIAYVSKSEKDLYRKERCKLDVYYPAKMKGYSTIVWFHGGSLEGGSKEVPYELMNKGVAVVAVNYRLSPKAKNPAYLEDAAQAVAWTFTHIAQFGGDPNKIFVSGHSAGGYLTLIIGLDKSYLQRFGIDANRIKGLIPISGQTNTHFTIKKERGLPYNIPLIDNFAPIHFARTDTPPLLLITGDKNLELMARYEENAQLFAVLRGIGNKHVELYELQGFDHGSVYHPACLLMLNWIQRILKN